MSINRFNLTRALASFLRDAHDKQKKAAFEVAARMSPNPRFTRVRARRLSECYVDASRRGLKNMNNELEFLSRQEFRLWLTEHSQDRNGLWIIFRKGKTSNTLKSSEALEEALCFGWIDGQIKPIDDEKYMKYFAPRGEKSTWSEKNKKLAEELIKAGLFTENGLAAIARSKANGLWDQEKKNIDLESLVKALADSLKEDSIQAYELYRSSSESKQRQMARFYADAKSEEVRKKREGKIIGALLERKKGMLY